MAKPLDSSKDSSPNPVTSRSHIWEGRARSGGRDGDGGDGGDGGDTEEV